MSGFEWTEAMSVGVPALDSDHKCLIRIINLLQDIHDNDDASRVVEMVLDTLTIYGRFHFAREESVMEACDFPGTAFHKGEHKGFGQYIASLRKRFQSGADEDAAGELLDYLTEWLRHHILIQDMAFKPYIVGVPKVEELVKAVGPPLPELQLQ